jgi:hypothetical protein
MAQKAEVGPHDTVILGVVCVHVEIVCHCKEETYMFESRVLGCTFGPKGEEAG